MVPNHLPPELRFSATLDILKSLLPFLVALATVLALATCADEGGDTKDEEEQVVEEGVPSGLVADCDSLSAGGALVVDGGGRSGNLERSQCTEYTFIGEPGVTYTIVLTVLAGNADLLVAFNDTYTSLVGTSANSGTATDSVTFESGLSAEYFIAVNSSLQASAFTITVQTGGGDGGGTGGGGEDTSAPVTSDTTPPSGSTIGDTAQIVVTFDESMDTGSLVLGGDMATESDGGVWSQTTVADDTLTIGPATVWTEGVDRTLTLDADDLAGNALATLSLVYSVDATAPAGIESPISGSLINGGTPIIVTFDESMDTGSLVLGGTMATESDGGVWSQTTVADDTLTIGPATAWSGGVDRSLTIDVADVAGNALATLSSTYTVDATAPLGSEFPASGS
ncbi:MAG: Ig-like domain-containing protein, partial [SAR324 cluster bacterium]|nr:Ig-like domain-containing protein [SAR324 cluster bacterium]